MLTKIRAFTLFEILLVMSLISMIFIFAAPIYSGFLVSNDLTQAENALVQALKRSQSLASSGENDSSWGVRIQSESITLFSGSSYAARDTTFDEITRISDKISVSGLTEVVFSKQDAEPGTTGTFIFNGNNGDIRN